MDLRSTIHTLENLQMEKRKTKEHMKQINDQIEECNENIFHYMKSKDLDKINYDRYVIDLKNCTKRRRLTKEEKDKRLLSIANDYNTDSKIFSDVKKIKGDIIPDSYSIKMKYVQ